MVDQPLLDRRRVDEVVLADVARPVLLVVDILELGAVGRGGQARQGAEEGFSQAALAYVTSES